MSVSEPSFPHDGRTWYTTLVSSVGFKMVSASFPCVQPNGSDPDLVRIQEKLDFAAKQGETADIEIILVDYVNTVMDRVLKSDVRYPFVINVHFSFGSVTFSYLFHLNGNLEPFACA
ncbi:cinnamyl alcohol dehydrogenase [Artemisia annua]|uniref:Cinnamyl alcohol dehydrogenase n=1 Tax=Artemisia annua TaxID=35608 RepID=A0A2U1LQF6_ARTAN|nr:cinnamyl alcohol dehydrogenase [Artemisia annua]